MKAFLIGIFFLIAAIFGFQLVMNKKASEDNVLVVLAHPDDETMIAGTLVFLKDLGKNIKLVYATDGEGGKVYRLTEDGYESEDFPQEALRALRIRENERALEELGLMDVVRLGQPDMPLRDPQGNPSTDIELFVESGSWNLPFVYHRIQSLMEEFRPSLVITMGSQENYHAHHQTIGKVTLDAAQSLPYGPSVYAISEHRWVEEVLGATAHRHEFQLDLNIPWASPKGKMTMGEYVYPSVRQYQTQPPGLVGVPRDIEKIHLVDGPVYPSFSLDR